jgi:hypothetical protein
MRVNGGKHGQSTDIRRSLVPASNQAPSRRNGAKGVLPGLVHPAWPDLGWDTLAPHRDRPHFREPPCSGHPQAWIYPERFGWGESILTQVALGPGD